MINILRASAQGFKQANQLLTYSIMMKAQLIFTQTFVDDLLTLKEIPTNCLKFVDKAFNPNAIFKLLDAIFE